MDQIKPDRHYLGRICRHGHEWQDTGLSLRYKKSKACVVCVAERGKAVKRKNREKIKKQQKKYMKRYLVENRERLREAKRDRYSKNKEVILEQKKEYRVKNRAKLVEYDKEYERKTNRGKLQVQNLHDNYIKGRVVALGVFKSAKEIPQELIQLKREQMILMRELRRLKNGVA